MRYKINDETQEFFQTGISTTINHFISTDLCDLVFPDLIEIYLGIMCTDSERGFFGKPPMVVKSMQIEDDTSIRELLEDIQEFCTGKKATWIAEKSRAFFFNKNNVGSG